MHCSVLYVRPFERSVALDGAPLGESFGVKSDAPAASPDAIVRLDQPREVIPGPRCQLACDTFASVLVHWAIVHQLARLGDLTRVTFPAFGHSGPIGNVRQSEVMPFLIRDAESTDMDDLQGVFQRASMSNEHDRGLLREHPEWLILSDLGIVEGRTRVAVDGDGPITGFATHLISDGVAELEDLFVDPPRMREGIAVALVLDICSRLHQRGFETLEVTANPHALAFYEHVGFVEDRMVETAGYPARRMRRSTRAPR